VLGDLVRHLPHAAGNLPLLARAAADTGGPVGLDLDLPDLRLPFAVTREVVDVGEDVLG